MGYEPLRGCRVLFSIRCHQLHEATSVSRGRWIHHVLHEVIEIKRTLAIRIAVPVDPPTQDTALIRVPLDESLEREQLAEEEPNNPSSPLYLMCQCQVLLVEEVLEGRHY